MKKLTITVMLLALAQIGLAEAPISERAPLNENAALEVINVAGSIAISGWRNKEIEVTGTLGSDEELTFEASGDRALVEIKSEGRSRDWKDRDHYSSGTQLVIRVPFSTRLNVRAVSADVVVTDIRGSQRVRTVSGNIDSKVDNEEAELRSVSGEIEAVGNGKKGSFELYSVSGDVKASNFAGEIHGESVSGDLELTVSDASEVRLKTVSGDMEAALGLMRDAKVHMESVSGDVDVRLPKGYEANYELTSFSGDISDVLGKAATRKSEYAPGSELTFTHGNGSGRVRVNTLSGDIEITTDM